MHQAQNKSEVTTSWKIWYLDKDSGSPFDFYPLIMFVRFVRFELDVKLQIAQRGG